MIYTFDTFIFSHVKGRVLVGLADGTVAVFHRAKGESSCSCTDTSLLFGRNSNHFEKEVKSLVGHVTRKCDSFALSYFPRMVVIWSFTCSHKANRLNLL